MRSIKFIVLGIAHKTYCLKSIEMRNVTIGIPFNIKRVTKLANWWIGGWVKVTYGDLKDFKTTANRFGINIIYMHILRCGQMRKSGISVKDVPLPHSMIPMNIYWNIYQNDRNNWHGYNLYEIVILNKFGSFQFGEKTYFCMDDLWMATV